MIRVNLLGEKRDNSAAHTLQLVVAGGTMVLLIAACGILHTTVSNQLAVAEQKRASLNIQLEKLRQKTAKVDELEKKKKLLYEKLTTIATLKAKKQGPVRVLDDLTNGIPARAWLQSVSQKSEALEFSGIALDPQTVSLFMTYIKNSPFYSEVDLNFSRQYMREGVKLQQFSVVAKLADPLMRKKKEAEADKANPAQPAEEVAADVPAGNAAVEVPKSLARTETAATPDMIAATIN